MIRRPAAGVAGLVVNCIKHNREISILQYIRLRFLEQQMLFEEIG